MPKDFGELNCGSFVSGVVKGILDSSGFLAQVSTHYVAVEGQSRPRTTILMKFNPEVMAREQRLGNS